tara:strand:- start:164 stop:502 length:339 start_codon:yes stop_codon:yes gene_type:complete
MEKKMKVVEANLELPLVDQVGQIDYHLARVEQEADCDCIGDYLMYIASCLMDENRSGITARVADDWRDACCYGAEGEDGNMVEPTSEERMLRGAMLKPFLFTLRAWCEEEGV